MIQSKVVMGSGETVDIIRGNFGTGREQEYNRNDLEWVIFVTT